MEKKIEIPSKPNSSDFLTEEDKKEIGKMLSSHPQGRDALFAAFEAYLFDLADVRSLDLKNRDGGNIGFIAAIRYWATEYLSDFFRDLTGFVSKYETYLKSKDRKLPLSDKEFV